MVALITCYEGFTVPDTYFIYLRVVSITTGLALDP